MSKRNQKRKLVLAIPAAVLVFSILAGIGIGIASAEVKIIGFSDPTEPKVNEQVTIFVSVWNFESGPVIPAPVINGTVIFYVNDNEIGQRKTGENGEAFILYTFTSSGTHNIRAYYTGDAGYGSANETFSVEVAPQPTPTPTPAGNGGTSGSGGDGGGGGVPRDSDGDGLSDVDEKYIYKTDPYKADTDGGGVNDGTEVARGTNPRDPTDDVVVTPTPTATITPTVTPAVSPTVTAAPTASPSPDHAHTPTPKEPGFETVFAIATLLAVAYLVLRSKK